VHSQAKVPYMAKVLEANDRNRCIVAEGRTYLGAAVLIRGVVAEGRAGVGLSLAPCS
jgi:hypothetical protein